MVAEGPELTRADVDKLRALVFMDNHYVLDRKKRVPFIPQLAVVLKTAEGETTVLAALYTAQLRFVYGDQQVTIDCDPSVEEWREFALNFIKLPGLNEAQQ